MGQRQPNAFRTSIIAMRLICHCGGEVPRPVPPNCPHCGRIITHVHRSPLAWLWPLVVIGGFFALLLAGTFALVNWFGG
jgi:uncharacterized paraquat-inducible protein A